MCVLYVCVQLVFCDLVGHPKVCSLTRVLSHKSKGPTAIAISTFNFKFRKQFTIGVHYLISANKGPALAFALMYWKPLEIWEEQVGLWSLMGKRHYLVSLLNKIPKVWAMFDLISTEKTMFSWEALIIYACKRLVFWIFSISFWVSICFAQIWVFFIYLYFYEVREFNWHINISCTHNFLCIYI